MMRCGGTGKIKVGSNPVEHVMWDCPGCEDCQPVCPKCGGKGYYYGHMDRGGGQMRINCDCPAGRRE